MEPHVILVGDFFATAQNCRDCGRLIGTDEEAVLHPNDALTCKDGDHDLLGDIVEHHKQAARSRGWLTGDINQTDAWFGRRS